MAQILTFNDKLKRGGEFVPEGHSSFHILQTWTNRIRKIHSNDFKLYYDYLV